jgi:hypothetical protein
MKLALQIGLGIVIGSFGCWLVAIFFTAAFVASLPAIPHQTVDMSHMFSPSRSVVLTGPSAGGPPAGMGMSLEPMHVVVARELQEVNGDRVTVLTRPEYHCVRDRTQVPVAITCVNTASRSALRP